MPKDIKDFWVIFVGYINQAKSKHLRIMKKNYEKLSVSVVEFRSDSPILAGSKTSVPIKVNQVTVEEYHQGFGTPGGDDFQTISFD